MIFTAPRQVLFIAVLLVASIVILSYLNFRKSNETYIAPTNAIITPDSILGTTSAAETLAQAHVIVGAPMGEPFDLPTTMSLPMMLRQALHLYHKDGKDGEPLRAKQACSSCLASMKKKK